MLKIILPTISLLLLTSNSYWYQITTSLMLISLVATLTHLNSSMTNSMMSSSLTADDLSMPLITLTLWITSMMILASNKILYTSNNPSTFLFYCILLCSILLFAFSTKSLMSFYIMFEASLIPTLLLILGWGYQPERLQAGLYLMMYTITASLPLLLSILSLYMLNNHMNMMYTSWNSHSTTSFLLSLWWMMTIMAFLVKMPMYMTHLWLPKAHVEAPVAGSMILAGILLKLGSYGLMRMLSLFTLASIQPATIIMSISLWGASITGMICLRQADLKSLIAYSSVGHMGILTAGLMSNSTWGWSGALTMMIAHGLTSSAMFALANMMYESTNTRSVFISKGMMSIAPNMATMWFMLLATNMAAPPSINLLSEIMLISGTLSTSSWTAMCLALTSFLAAAYSLHLYSSAQHGQIPSFMSPLHSPSSLNYSTALLHLSPLILFIAAPETLTSWL